MTRHPLAAAARLPSLSHSGRTVRGLSTPRPTCRPQFAGTTTSRSTAGRGMWRDLWRLSAREHARHPDAVRLGPRAQVRSDSDLGRADRVKRRCLGRVHLERVPGDAATTLQPHRRRNATRSSRRNAWSSSINTTAGSGPRRFSSSDIAAGGRVVPRPGVGRAPLVAARGLEDDLCLPAAGDERLPEALERRPPVRADRFLHPVEAVAVADLLEPVAVGISRRLPSVTHGIGDRPMLLLRDPVCEVSCALGVHGERVRGAPDGAPLVCPARCVPTSSSASGNTRRGSRPSPSRCRRHFHRSAH
jgi:hypothetical protein